MKTISAELSAHIAGEVTTLATCWKLTRRDGAIQGFTDHDAPLTLGGVTYQAETGFTPTAIGSSASLAVDNLQAEGMLSAESIAEADIMAGLYDFAEMEVFMVNHADLTQGALPLKRGWLGEVRLDRGRFTAEIRGLSQALQQNIGELFSPSCRASLGDARCGVSLGAHTVTGSVTSADSGERQIFVDSARSEESGLFTFGTITFTSGLNDGLSMEVKEHRYRSGQGATLILALPMPYALAEGDAYSLSKGCDKTLSTCKSRFDNVLNFRGEPHIPGLDRMLETAGTRSARG